MFKRCFLTIAFIVFGGVILLNPVSAQDDLSACDFLPCSIFTGEVDSEDANVLNPDFELDRVFRFAVNGIFMAFMLAGVALVVRAAIVATKSEGNEEELQKSFTTTKSALVGILLIVFGIIGIFLVISIFEADNLLNRDIDQVDPPGLNVDDALDVVL